MTESHNLQNQIQQQYGEWLEPAELLEMTDVLQANIVAQRIPMEIDQVQNNAGGFVYEVDDLTRVRRFLCLGTSGGTYYVGEKQMQLENAMAIVDMIGKGKGLEVVKEIVEISLAGRAAKQNPTLYALAICARYPCETLAESDRAQVRIAAYEAFLKVCRIPTHVFTFVGYCEAILDKKTTGWGRSHRKAIQRWYLEQEPEHLAMQITKYQQREGWSHRDVVRLAHVDPNQAKADSAPIYDDLFLYITKGFEARLERQQKTDEAPATGDSNPTGGGGEEKKRRKTDEIA